MRAPTLLPRLLALLALAAPSGAALAELPPGGRAPTLVALRAAGAAPRDLGQLRGRGVLLVFLSTQCPHCRRVLPRLNALHDAGSGLRVLGACADDAARLEGFVRGQGVRFELWRVEKEALRDYDVRALPSAYVLSGSGRILWSGDPARLDDEALARWAQEALPAPAAATSLASLAEALARDDLCGMLTRLEATVGAADARFLELSAWTERHAARRLAEARQDREAGRLRDAWAGLDALARALPALAVGRTAAQERDALLARPEARREIEAGALLEEARALLRAERKDEALAKLDALVARYAGTETAGRAAALVRRLRRTS